MLYLHIPFCASRCVYCGFYSTTLLSLRDAYVRALRQEMRLRAGELTAGCGPHTIYIGGGTPSQLTGGQLASVFDGVRETWPWLLGAGVEVTIECNPSDVVRGFDSVVAALPVNRVSLGVQSFDDALLRFAGRRHNGAEAAEAVGRLRRVGIGNVSIDLIFGFPGQTLAAWREDLRKALTLRPEHISAYSLMVEEGTRLHALCERGAVAVADEELSHAMYDTLIDTLVGAGYEHYEISNFALLDNQKQPHTTLTGASVGAPCGYRSRHNSRYWQDSSYVGLGAGAHSYRAAAMGKLGERSWNVSDVRAYIEAVAAGRRPAEAETIDEVTHYNDLITTALRRREGLALANVPSALRTHLCREAAPHVAAGRLAWHDGSLCLTRAGLFVSDDVMSDLVFV